MEKVKINGTEFMKFRNIFEKIEFDIKQSGLKKKGKPYWKENKQGAYKKVVPKV